MKKTGKVLAILVGIIIGLYFFVSFADNYRTNQAKEREKARILAGNHELSNVVPNDKEVEQLGVAWVLVRVGADITLRDGQKFVQGVYWEIKNCNCPKKFPEEEEVKKDIINALNMRVSPSVKAEEIQEIILSYTDVTFFSFSTFQLRKGAELVIVGDDFSMPVKSYEITEQPRLPFDRKFSREGTKIPVHLSAYTEPLIQKVVGTLREKGQIFRLSVLHSSAPSQ